MIEEKSKTENITNQSANHNDVADNSTAKVEAGKVINLTEDAVKKVDVLLAVEQRPELKLRVAVQPGGCSGLIYQLFFDDRDIEGDVVETFNDKVSVVVDKMSAPYLQGSVIDYTDTIMKQGFTLDNPNAGGTCACGDSFH